MSSGKRHVSGTEEAVVFLDLLGFGDAVKDDMPAAAGLLEDYGGALTTAIQDGKVYPPESYRTQELRRVAERSLITSFRCVLPMSDSVFIISDDPSLLVFQVSQFLVNSFWRNVHAFEFPEGADPRTVTVKDLVVGKDGVRTQPHKEHWLPVLFRGGMAWGDVRVYKAPALVDGVFVPRAVHVLL